MTIVVYTLGCKLNQCESEAVAAAFVQEGFTVGNSSDTADLYIVNTCTVTSKAEQKARRMIRKFAIESQHPVVIVTGCYAQLEREALERLSDRVVVLSLDRKSSLLRLPAFMARHAINLADPFEAIRSFVIESEHEGSRNVFDYDAVTFSYHSRAFLKIQDGCDNACAYCRVTIARGDAVSLDIDEVIERALSIERRGYKEIVLTGVNITAYSSNGQSLGFLVRRLLQELCSEMRIRLSSLEPDRLDDELIGVLADRRIQPHFHIPVQSASDIVLARCRRHYDEQRLRASIEALRNIKGDPFIAADIITGLPGETDAEFEKTVAFVKDLNLSQLHVFPFSPRPLTELFDAYDRVPESIRDQRAQILRSLSSMQLQHYVGRQIGTKVEVMLEQTHASVWSGLTGNYLKVRCLDLPGNASSGMRFTAVLEYDAERNLPFVRYQSRLAHTAWE
ncbi:MAG: tRNA (N(6)-L-threonylcarbamoyladenosine(37)-C(2))-methylthiotransferase MtaB [Sphaerochaetaceae bacterium]|nr:tRNA (N(6)-L-threonylcarbamoyladenosine(37)-C(2))-methylthiotransferase MtaB [Sphaerochaetaceae bacterium]